MAIRIPWDKYEAALLLDYCIKVENKVLSRDEAVSIVSQRLRRRAIVAGLEIDDVFRNENGISMQYSAMRNCYIGKKNGLTISKLFYEIVGMQRDDPDAFYQILQEESEIMETSTWQEFLQWIQENYPEQEKSTLSSLMLVNALGRKSRLLKSPLGDICDSEEIDKLANIIATSSATVFHSKKNAAGATYALRLYADYLRENNSISKTDSEESCVSGFEALNDKSEFFTVDFNVIQSYAHTKPVSCKYKGRSIEQSGWNAIFHALVQAIYIDYTETFPVGQSLSSSSRIDTGSSDGMIYPKEIAEGIYLECNVNATGVVNKLRSLMDICGIDYENVQIQYRSTEKGTDKNQVKVHEVTAKWTPQYTAVISQIISAKYKYGFRIGSPIEMMKIRNYAETADLILPASDEELEKEISAAGIVIDGKVYVFSDALLSELGSIIDGIFQSGVTVIFLNSLMEEQEEWLEENHLTSEQLLKEVIKTCRPQLYFGQNIIATGNRITEHEAVVAEIHRIAGDNALVLTTDLDERLSYIPYEKIAWSLSASDEFVWVSEGKYFRLDYFTLSEGDSEAILKYVAEECGAKGYASITDVPMGDIAEENYELSVTALYSAIYNVILKDKYYLNGKILTTDKNGVDISILLKAYCQDRDKCTVTEMMERAEELSGSSNKQYAITALYDTLVRSDVDQFISEKNVYFEVDRIDELLETIVGNRFAPIRKVSTFALFPPCGINWNHYLLESYCYRFSKKYRLCVLNYNDKNAGIIASIDLPLTYNDMLCEAAAVADVELTPEAVGEFFFANGYTAKRKYSNMTEILEKAQTIREER